MAGCSICLNKTQNPTFSHLQGFKGEKGRQERLRRAHLSVITKGVTRLGAKIISTKITGCWKLRSCVKWQMHLASLLAYNEGDVHSDVKLHGSENIEVPDWWLHCVACWHILTDFFLILTER